MAKEFAREGGKKQYNFLLLSKELCNIAFEKMIK